MLQSKITDRYKISTSLWLFGCVLCFTILGFVELFSAAQGNLEPWAIKQIYTAAFFLPFMLMMTLIDIEFFKRNAYLFYGIGIFLLVVAEILGHKAMGAQRWIRIGFINFQPSELMKLLVITALARHFSNLHSSQVGYFRNILFPIFIVILPVALILKQPNLGTALIILFISAAIFFAAGVKAWNFILVAVASACSLPIIWQFMHDYQRKRVLMFLNPESDPLGAGYNIIQSMIAIGSGGMLGKGYIKGSQSQLNFLPEKHTDFILTIFAEEFGFIGVMLIFLLAVFLLYICYVIANNLKEQFAKLVVIGVATMFVVHVIINAAMISGSIPVVGTPFPFLSFGGSNLITMFLGFGLILSANVKSRF